MSRNPIARAAGAAACLLVGLAPPASAQQLDRARAIVFGNGGQIATLDPARSDFAQPNLIISNLYDTLVTYGYDNRIAGRLAESFAVAPDAGSVRLTLRRDVRFQDGAPFTAADVAYTLDRLKRLAIGIAGQIPEYDRTEVHGDHEVTIHLSRPSSLFLGALSKIYILNARLMQANAGTDDGQAWLAQRGAGSGPYRLAGIQGQTIILAAQDSHWDGARDRPPFLVFRRIDEPATQRDEMRAGNIDVAIFGMTWRDSQQLEQENRGRDARLKPALQVNVIFNTRVGPTADPRVRQAIRHAFDYEGGLAAARGGRGTVANGPLPSTMPCRPERPIARRDLAEARRLLQEAGQANLTLTMRFQPAFETHRIEAALLQQNLREIGVTLNLEPIAFPAYLASLRSPDQIPQLMLLDDFAQFPEPGTMLFRGFRSDAVGTNRGGYANPEVDQLIDQANVTGDFAARCALYERIQTILDTQSVTMPLYTVERPAPFRPQQLQEPQAHPVVFPLLPSDLRLARRP